VLKFDPDLGAEKSVLDTGGAMVDTDSLPLTAELRARVDAWTEPAAYDYADGSAPRSGGL
jgi:hypothetical protein